jgi:hypothetical protein
LAVEVALLPVAPDPNQPAGIAERDRAEEESVDDAEQCSDKLAPSRILPTKPPRKENWERQ